MAIDRNNWIYKTSCGKRYKVFKATCDICNDDRGYKLSKDADKTCARCKDIDITPTNENTVILSRSGRFFSTAKTSLEINPWVEKSNFTREFMKGKYLYDNKKFVTGLKYIERAYVKILLNRKLLAYSPIVTVDQSAIDG